MMTSYQQRPGTRWVEVVDNQQRLTPPQYQAFQQAIAQVKERLHQVLSRPTPQRQGRFDLNTFVDSLYADFVHAEQGSETDVGQTAWWITRYLADQLLELQQLEQARSRM